MTSSDFIDRLPPHSIEAEVAVLGCLLLSPCETMPACLERFRDGSEAFYDLRHRTIYEAAVDLYTAQQPIDLITLAQRLTDKQQLEAVGGFEYLAPLPDKVSSAASVRHYIATLADQHTLRRLLMCCTETAAKVYDHSGQVAELVDAAESDLLSIGRDRQQSQAASMHGLVQQAIDQIEAQHSRQGQLSGLSTGFADLDRMTGGLQPGDMIVLAARPSVGKTSLALNIAEAVTIEAGLPVGVFSLEMSARALVLRLMCGRARVNLRHIRDGLLVERDFPKLTGAAGRLMSAKLHIDESSSLTIMQLRAKARRMWHQHGIKLVIVDYLQLLQGQPTKRPHREQEVAEISRGLKALAKELNVPVLVLSQLNRELEKRKDGRPVLADLRESGSIEADADVVCLMHADKEDRQSEAGLVRLLIAKQRNGPTGEIALTFLREFTRFENAAKIDRESETHWQDR